MSDIITPEDLPPINELDEFTANIPELQIDTDVLAGTGGPANFQAQALANRTKYLKRILDAVSLELNGINQAVATAQQVADASMKKAANGADIADAAQFRNNVGLKNAATHDVQTSATDATVGRILKIADNGEGSFGLGGNAIAIPAGSTIPTYFNNLPTGFYRAGSNITGTFSPICDYQWIRHDANNGVLIAVGIGAIGAMAFRLFSATGWSGWRTVWHDGNITAAGMYADRGPIGTGDLDTLFGADYRGTWTQGATANATLARHYPVVSAGSLDITYNAVTGVGTVQKYTTHVTNRVFIRRRATIDESWSDWAEFWTTANLANPATLDTSQTITGDKLFTRPIVVRPDGAVATGIELGSINAATSTYIDFHSSGNNNDYDVRLLCTLGAAASGQGDLNINASAVRLNGSSLVTSNTSQTISGAKTFSVNPNIERSGFPGVEFSNLATAAGTIGKYRLLTSPAAPMVQIYSRVDAVTQAGQVVTSIPTAATGTVLVTGNNVVTDSGGFYKTASPVINIYSDGSFTTTDEAVGVDVKRLSEGVYKITGCQGMHPDAAWNGIDGGISNPKCRNDKALLWNNYEVDEDGSITVYTFHRVHHDAMPFAQNRLTLDKEPFDAKKGHTVDMEWTDQTPIDVPKGLFIQVRVNMPERIEPKPVISHSNVYCNSVSPAK
ncbi:hypothetical protein IG611_01495 [Pectobacterium sp. A535-S3-A17]|uniref:pyocin knob domain-containing protein n=1 Tax=Pectobacterium quasiaquaticum TaxID=2774015 RepID=UPI0018759FF3|nr:pyocin knob domain-containing protein [Pectobacterium quasiaquaticum]MBE5213288.1 hypothetical protein [Pectobacterium quasiaquaticum]MBE5224062.1 hypothetical protein [Pectobacterium quasiaquaticum]